MQIKQLPPTLVQRQHLKAMSCVNVTNQVGMLTKLTIHMYSGITVCAPMQWLLQRATLPFAQPAVTKMHTLFWVMYRKKALTKSYSTIVALLLID